MTFFLGIDLATSATKVVVLDSDGVVRGHASTPYPTLRPNAFWSEQNPEDWWTACLSSIRVALDNASIPASKVESIGLTGQMCGLVLIGNNGSVLRPAILWNDRRSHQECEEIIRIIGREELLRITGNLASPGLTAPKILWVRSHEPDIYSKISGFLLPKDYLRFRLGGVQKSDVSDASGTLLLDINTRRWSNDIVDKLGIPSSWLPSLGEGMDITGYVSRQASAATGLREGVPIIAGGADQAVQAIGMGIVSPQMAALTLGTSANLLVFADQPLIEPKARLRSFCHCIPGIWYSVGITISAGDSLRWLKDGFAEAEIPVARALEIDVFELLTMEAERVPPGSKGLIFLPYLSGVRTPHLDPLARGAFVGLTMQHDKAYLTRAILEGVAFAIRDSAELIRESGFGSLVEIHASGGGMKSRLWKTIVATVMHADLHAVNSIEGAAIGAGLMAGVATGAWSDLQVAVARTISQVEMTAPLHELLPLYDRLYELYRPLYQLMQTTFRELAKFEENRQT